MAKFATLVDDFSTQNTATWDGYTSGFATTVSNQLQITSNGGYVGLRTTGDWDLAGSYVLFQLNQVPTTIVDGTNPSLFPEIRVGTDGANVVRWNWEGNTMLAVVQSTNGLPGGNPVIGTIAHTSANNGRWYRIREAAGTIYWDYSANGTSWTNLGSWVWNFAAITNMRLFFYAGWASSANTSPPFLIDNLNNAPTGVLTGSATGASTFGATVVGRRSESRTATGASVFGATVTGSRKDSGSVTGATVFGSSLTGADKRSGSATGATVFGSNVVGSNTDPAVTGTVNGITVFGANAIGWSSTTLVASATGDTYFSAEVAGQLTGAGVAQGEVLGQTTFGATVSGAVGQYFRTPAYKQHPRDRHPLIARTWIPVGITLLKFGNSYRTYIDRDPELVAQADKAYIGGHLYFIDFTEATALANAGYGQWLSDQPPSSGGDDFQMIDYSQYGSGPYGTGPYGA